MACPKTKLDLHGSNQSVALQITYDFHPAGRGVKGD